MPPNSFHPNQVAEKAASAFGGVPSISYASAKGSWGASTEISGCGIYLFDVSVPLLQSALRYTYIQIQRLAQG